MKSVAELKVSVGFPLKKAMAQKKRKLLTRHIDMTSKRVCSFIKGTTSEKEGEYERDEKYQFETFVPGFDLVHGVQCCLRSLQC